MTEEESIKSVFNILKRATITIKIAPFVLVFLYAFCIVSYMFTNESTQIWLDLLFYISPLTVVLLYILSIIMKMCIWHRIECILPLTQLLIVIIDTIYPLTEMAAFVNVFSCSVLLLLYVINGYFTFIRR